MGEGFVAAWCLGGSPQASIVGLPMAAFAKAAKAHISFFELILLRFSFASARNRLSGV